MTVGELIDILSRHDQNDIVMVDETDKTVDTLYADHIKVVRHEGRSTWYINVVKLETKPATFL